MLKSRNKEVSVMEKVKLTTYLSAELVEKIKIQAIKEKRSVANILEQLVKEYLDKVAAD